MATRKNPNAPTKSKGVSRFKRRQKKKQMLAANKIHKVRDEGGTSIQKPQISGKKARKLMRKQGYDMNRKLEEEMKKVGVVKMVDAPPKQRKEATKDETKDLAKEMDAMELDR